MISKGTINALLENDSEILKLLKATMERVYKLEKKVNEQQKEIERLKAKYEKDSSI